MPTRDGAIRSGRGPGDGELAGWLRLQYTPGIGILTAHKLLSAFGLPEQIFAAGYDAIARIVPARLAQALCAPQAGLEQLLDLTCQWQAQPGHAILTLADPAYPAALLATSDPPLLLYVKGRLSLLAQPALAIVGSRHATRQGKADAECFAEALSAAGLTIVSGLALGIDACAHLGALRAAGSTIAVIGTGCDRVYPAANRVLAAAIAEQGCIVSEYALGTRALAANFPRRNRLIAALARGVLVVEAAAQSGSLITARLAAEQGRDVFAMPGSIHAPLSKGCHRLIKDGAKLVESVADILDELGWAHAPAASPAEAAGVPDVREGDEARVLGMLEFDAVDLDTLVLRTGLAVAPLGVALLALELDGQVERLPGGSYRRLISAQK